jgi:hypothetical protein
MLDIDHTMMSKHLPSHRAGPIHQIQVGVLIMKEVMFLPPENTNVATVAKALIDLVA